jgi:hypothetical protein
VPQYFTAMRRTLALAGLAALLLIAASAPAPAGSKARILFDDFSYANRDGLATGGWVVRTASGWPGIEGARWAAEGVTLVDDPARRGNRLLRLSAATDGTPGGTSQAQVCHQRKFLGGTYAARVRFRDAPTVGPGGDQVVETFYAISPLKKPLDPSYSELDVEYLPNGGWGYSGPTLFATTWETFRPEPNWSADNTSVDSRGTRDGWHTLVLQVARGTVVYWVDGRRFAAHGAPYYPEAAMSINANLWFVRGGLLPAGKLRRYDEDFDWIFHEAGAVLSPRQVAAKVAGLRKGGVRFRDTVPAALPSACNL